MTQQTAAPVSPAATVVEFVSNPEVLKELRLQLKEEIGDQELTEPELRQLQQKYGIIPPKFTGVETNIMLQEGRTLRAAA